MRFVRAMRLGIVVLACMAAGGGRAADPAPEVTYIPIAEGGIGAALPRMLTGVYRPPGDGPFPVLIYSHGRSGTEAERGRTRVPDPRGHVRYWLSKGFAVVAALRPGYGESGGAVGEDSGVRFDMFGNCWWQTDFARSADVASAAVLKTLAWVRRQPWADAHRIVLAGASMGGLASIASAATHPDGVVAYINFSGGTGGNGTRSPEHNCGLETMAPVMAAYGRRMQVPSLWLYAMNDSYWGADWPRAWFDAYAAADRAPTHLVMTEPVPNADGHQLLTRGSRLWAAHVDRFLADLGF